jgi:hypothetical protein
MICRYVLLGLCVASMFLSFWKIQFTYVLACFQMSFSHFLNMSHQGILKNHNQIDFEALQIITLEHIDSIILILIVMLLINQVMNS